MRPPPEGTTLSRSQEKAARRNGRAVTVRLDDVEPRPVEWLWPGYLPIGKVSLLDGDADRGKSLLTLDLAARVSTGRGFPDGAPCEVGGVVVIGAEDDLADTVRPRLNAAGADSSRILCLAGVRAATGKVTPASLADLDALEEAVRLVTAKLVIVDGLVDFFGPGSLFNARAVRSVLVPLGRLAQRLGFAIVLIRHFVKSRTTAMNKGVGSTAVAAVARSGLFVVKDPADDSRRILASFKNNLSALEPPALAFRFVDENGTGRLLWEGRTDWTAESLFAASLEDERSKSARAQARKFLQTTLCRGPLPTKEVIDAGKLEGFAPRTLERARRDLGIKSERSGGREGAWYLRLVPPLSDAENEQAGGPPEPSVPHSPDKPEAKDRQEPDGGLCDPSLPPGEDSPPPSSA